MSGTESSRSFVDANVWLYALILAQNPEKTSIAKSTIEGGEIALSTQVVNEVCVNLIKKAGFGEVDIRDLIESFYAKYHVVAVARADQLKACDLRERYRFSYWDSLIVAAALASGSETLYTEDMQTGLVIEDRLRIIDPFSRPHESAP